MNPLQPGSTRVARRALLSRLDDPRVVVPLLLALALVLRLPNLLQSLWLDEALKATHERFTTVAALLRYISDDAGGAPGYLVAMYFWVELFGEHELAVRLPSLVFGLGSIWIVYRIAGRFGASPLLAALLLCLSPAMVWYSRDASQYAMLAFLVLVAVALWPRVASTPFSWRAHAVYVLALTVACFAHYYAVLFLVPFTILSVRSEKPIRHTILLDHVLIASALGLWLFAQYVRGSMVTALGHLRPFTLFEWWMLYFHWFLQGNTLFTVFPYDATLQHVVSSPALLVLQLTAALLLARGLWPDRAPRSGWAAIEIGLHLSIVPLALLVLTLAGFDRLYMERYVLVALPFFAIALARGVSNLPPGVFRYAATAMLVAVNVAAYAALVREDVRWTVYKQNPDWRSAAIRLDARSTTSERMILVGVVPLADFGYHLRRQMANRRPPIRWDNPARHDRFVTSSGATQIVVVRNGAWTDRSDEVIERYRRDARLRLAWHDRFKLVDLYTFVPVTPPATRP